MDLNSELAVLSACNTGAGAVVSGEGVVNLSSGFLAAGINSVLMSLWLVNDRSTSELMTNFYYELDQGAAKHQALRNAKLEYLKNASSLEAHPYFWSAFVINGNMRPLNQPVGWWVWALGLTVITLAALGYYRLKS
ncbi:MAG: CHAT domain-containing protein, partial [Bacteroidota bacterium]